MSWVVAPARFWPPSFRTQGGQNMRHFAPVGFALSLGMTLSAVFASGAAAQQKTNGPPIVVGTTISETGPLAEDAGYQVKGLQLGIADVNAKGGWLGRKVELKIYDDKSDAGTGVRLYTRLITQDRVNLLIGP